MADERFFFGTPGQLVQIHWPRGGVKATRARQVEAFNTDSGGVRISKMVGGKRRYTLSYDALEYAGTHSVLEAYEQGHNGVGPFVLLDPGRRNMLTANQSGATSEVNGTDNYTLGGSGSNISSTSAAYRRGPRSLRWFFTASPVSATLTLDAASTEWPGIPIYDRSHVFHFWALGAGTDAVITVAATITWLNSAGATLSTSTGSSSATNSSTWTQYTVVDTPPANAVYALCGVTVTGSTVVFGSILYLDQFQFEEGTTASDWVPGTGVLPVQVVSLMDNMPGYWPDYRDGPTLVLQEIGP